MKKGEEKFQKYGEMKELRDEGKTFQEIGDIYRISRQRVHQIVTGYRSRFAGVYALEKLFGLYEPY